MSPEESGQLLKVQPSRRRWMLMAVGLAVAALLAALLPMLLHAAPATAADPCATPANPIVAENCKPGNPASEWDIVGSGSDTIQGFATNISVNKGQTVQFKINTTATSYRLDIYRMGYYGGSGARKVGTVTRATAQTQPNCLTQPATGLVDCGNWAVSVSWAVPSDAVSGIYFAKAVRTSGAAGASHIFFIVRDDASHSDMYYQTSDTTWQAYNRYGGNSLYTGGPLSNPPRAAKVSYNRPFTTRANTPEDWVFNAEYPMVRWMESNGYDVSYETGIDTDRFGPLLKNHKVFMSSGHDEYWSGTQRTNVEAARDAGVNLAFFSGNEIFWKTRWENSIDGSNTDHRTLVSYKETHANAKIDPVANTWTGTWMDPRSFNPEGAKPQNALSGTLFTVTEGTSAMKVPSDYSKLRFWRNTSVASLTQGSSATLASGTVGYEWDSDVDNGSRPAGLFDLSSTTFVAPGVLQDFGSTYASGSATHTMTLYRKKNSGAPDSLVFGAGTVQWAWGLDANHDRDPSTADVRMQQATVNLLADMQAQPATLQTGLVAATASTDTVAPTTAIAAPADGSTVQPGTALSITGTASDTESGGQVAGVEVSVDGQTWHPALGTTSWRYTWTPSGSGARTIRARAVDDSGNLQSPVTSINVTVGSSPPPGCPCSLFDPATQAPSRTTSDNDGQAIEVGVKFTADDNGFVTALRFYKASDNTGTHVGHLWTSTGTQLAAATFTNESASGWQQVQLSNPVAVTAGTTYVASYNSSGGFYSVDDPYFTNPLDNPPLHAPSNATAGGNGVYRYGASSFPSASFNASNYWVDLVYQRSVGVDTTPPQISTVAPTSGATGVDPGASATATFNEAMNPATINGSNVQLRTASGNLVSATVSYDAINRIALLTPQSALAYSTTYTATVNGGTGGVTDTSGNALAQTRTWSFTTAAAPPPPPNDGPGGPILVIRSSANPFTSYFSEILRAEGLNAFTATDIGNVTAATLGGYDVVVLGQISLTASQVTMLSNWVQGGGNLIAMRPDKQLAGVLGLTDAGTTLANTYLKVDTGSAPGAGIAGATMQFHGTADRYTLNGASAVATLYSNASAATTNPAVTLRSVGTNGGQAAAFTYDLARSVVYTRQGNPAWAAQDRDGLAPIRSDDLFFGARAGDVQSDWVDLSKVAIPQADEQQRLLANLIEQMNLDRKPLPRFWYLPSGDKAAVVLSGDDHNNGGTAGQFDTYEDDSPSNCSVADWECVRSTSYMFPDTPLTDAQAAAYQAAGFELALHLHVSGNTGDCSNFSSAASLNADLNSQLADFASSWPSVTAPVTNRTHCIVWSDWSTEPTVERSHGIRLDANYYYWPGTWVQDRPGFFTGSGFPMRFAASDGSLIDVYQAATQLTDESDQTIPTEIKALLDKALGSEGYYGVITANMHTDLPDSPGADAIVAEATSRGVPVVSAKQMLAWVDGRNASAFGSIGFAANKLTFTVSPGSGARNLQAMVPTRSASGTLQSLTRGGNAVTTTTRTVKGIDYAFFAAAAGAYTATYGSDTTPPAISNVSAAPHADGTATITWTTDEASSSRVRYGTDPANLIGDSNDAANVSSHSVTLSGLTGGAQYSYRVSSTDAAGNTATSPATANPPAAFTMPAAVLADSSVAEFAAGTPGTSTFVGATGTTTDGEVQLLPTLGEEFGGTALPTGWSATAWATGGAGTVGSGALTVDGARAGTTATYTPARTLEFVGTFAGAAFQHIGFGVDYNNPPWAMFSSGGGALAVGLYARSNTGSTATNTPITGVSLTAPHRYRIVWTATSITFFVDGTQVASHPVALTTAMRPLASDFTVGGGASTSVSWIRMSPYAATGQFASRVLDAGSSSHWQTATATTTAPSGTTVALETRSGNTATPDGTWSAFQAVGAGGAIASPAGRYIQYRATLTSSATSATPSLERVAIAYGP